MLDLILQLTVYLFNVSEFTIVLLLILGVYALGLCINTLKKI